MNVRFNSTAVMTAQNLVRRFQLGGPMPGEEAGMPAELPMGPEGGAPDLGGAPQGGGEDQLAQVAQLLIEMLMQLVGDPQAVAQILLIALEMVSQGGGEAPAPLEEPVYRLGGRLSYRIRK